MNKAEFIAKYPEIPAAQVRETHESPEGWEDAEIIHQYTRADAIEDGTLIDVSSVAREAGITFPVAITSAAWAQFVAVPILPYGACQDESGRLWDVVWMLRHAIRTQPNGSEITVNFLCVVHSPSYVEGGMHAWKDAAPSPCKLKALCGPGDDMRPVITLMLTDED